MKEETIFKIDDIVVIIAGFRGYIYTLGEIYKVDYISDLRSMDTPLIRGTCYGGCQRASQLRHATSIEIQAYNEGIRNIKEIKQLNNYYFY